MRYLLTLFIGLSFFTTNAQIAYKEGSPKSFELNKPKGLQSVLLKINKNIERDTKTENPKEVNQIFALPISVNYNLFNSGEWFNIENTSIWRLKLKSTDAKNLSFQFENFFLPSDAEFYIYSSNRKDIRGPFTNQNNRVEKNFATYLVSGEEVVLELNVPKSQKTEAVVALKFVFHGLKGTMDFGDSGSCNNNINCPEGADWQVDKKAIALILSGGVNGLTWCSGAMVNNVREDGLPYFLTANHCLTGTEDDWAFVFNYESPDCSNTDGTYNQSVLGAEVKATDLPSDFALLLLDDSPPTNYGVYHAGWDARDILKDSTTAIHHPQGDIKKISFDYDSIEHSGYYTAGDDHWKVVDWDDGTTEPTSSGSPLYDKFHRIVGQLHGGSAACGNNLEDYYGKFSYSWDEGATAATRLKDWLDPDNTGTNVLNGNNFNVSDYNLDLGLLTFNNLDDRCDTLIDDLEINIKNLGSDTIFSVSINVYVDGDSIEQLNWNDTLLFASVITLPIDSFSVTGGNHEIKLIINQSNGMTDENTLNDTIIRYFNAINGNIIIADITTDFFGNETGALIYKDTSLLHSFTGYSGNATTTEEICLANGCYMFILTDSYGDGVGSGGATLSLNGIQFGTIDGNLFDYADTVEFCVQNGAIVSSQFPIDLSPNGFLYDENTLCSSQIDSIGFNVINHGFDTVIQFSTILFDNAIPVDTTVWNQTLMPGANVDLYLNYQLVAGSHNLKITTVSNLDSNQLNDNYIYNVTIVDGVNAELHFFSDGFANDIEYVITKDDTIRYQNNVYSFNDSIVEKFCLEDGCYKFKFTYDGSNPVNPDYFDFYLGDSLVVSFVEEIEDSLMLDMCILNGQITSIDGWYTINVGIAEMNGNQVLVYPNPAKDKLYIRSENELTEVRISDILGKQVFLNSNVKSNRIEVDLSDFTKGVYLVSINSPNRKSTKKLIVE